MYNLGLTPEKGSLELVFFISFFLVFLITLNVMGIMVRDSMVGDIADEVELQSGGKKVFYMQPLIYEIKCRP